jgi:hypothetical protein
VMSELVGQRSHGPRHVPAQELVRTAGAGGVVGPPRVARLAGDDRARDGPAARAGAVVWSQRGDLVADPLLRSKFRERREVMASVALHMEAHQGPRLREPLAGDDAMERASLMAGRPTLAVEGGLGDLVKRRARVGLRALLRGWARVPESGRGEQDGQGRGCYRDASKQGRSPTLMGDGTSAAPGRPEGKASVRSRRLTER